MVKPRIGVTIGDPAGIGPEICIKALANEAVHGRARIVAIGTSQVLQRMAQSQGTDMDFVEVDVSSQQEWSSTPRRLPVHQVGNLAPSDFIMGDVAAATGAASVSYVIAAARLGLQGHIDAIVTAPINKGAMRAAGVTYPGHTEILAAEMDASVETMFVVDRMRIFFLTRHVSLREAIERISYDGLLHLMEHARGFLMQTARINDPVIAVAGLNPHASDGGLFGDEEARIIEPAIHDAQTRGWKIVGPIGADSVFHQALQGRFDAVLSLYHDQGHIAAKTYDFDRTVSVTTGLPVLRTSVDHGTAFDIAGRGIADATNMEEALRVAVDMVSADKR